MKSGRITKLLMIAAVISFLVTSMQAQTYIATDLGTLRAGSARIHGINESGQAVGASGHPHGAETHAFFWQKQGSIRDLGILQEAITAPLLLLMTLALS
jgi:probable HAF family extracellular repeat protein